jgi:hypothetical protein
MEIIILFLGKLFLNSCLHGLQKLNYYNHVFLNYLQVLEIDLKRVAIWKIKFKYLKIGEMFLQVFGFFFQTLQYWCGEQSKITFLVNGVCFHN